jgi:hypothetical protein
MTYSWQDTPLRIPLLTLGLITVSLCLASMHSIGVSSSSTVPDNVSQQGKKLRAELEGVYRSPLRGASM